MARAKSEKAYVNLYLEAATVKALDEYAEMANMSRSQAANSIMASVLRDDVPAYKTVVDAFKGAFRKKKEEAKAESAVGALA